jgi:hypothetical protein
LNDTKRNKKMKSKYAFCACALALLVTVGCASPRYMYSDSCGTVPFGYSNTSCGITTCNDKFVPGPAANMMVLNKGALRGIGKRPLARQGQQGYNENDFYTTRAPRDFFLSSPMPLGE